MVKGYTQSDDFKVIRLQGIHFPTKAGYFMDAKELYIPY